MKPRSALLRRLSPLLLLALIAPVAAFAQAAETQAAPAPATSSQAASPQAASPQGAPSQGAPPETGSPPGTPASATGGQAPAAAGQPAPPAATGGQSNAAPAAGSANPSAPANSGPAYDVEIVIFRAKAALGQPENWAAETSTGATVAGGEDSNGSGVGRLLTVLPSADYRLTAIASRLNTSGTYLPVAHAAWVQTASAWGTHAGFPLESLGIDVPGLTGVVFLERGEYLHLGMTLNYTMQDPPAGLNAPPGTTFVMNETRRVRFYQRNYYDHPAFGVIALISPARGPRAPGR